MNDQYGYTGDSAEKILSPTALALVLGLALALPSSAALASEPMTAINISLPANTDSINAEEANDVLMQVSTTRGIKIADNNSPIPINRRAAPRSSGGDERDAKLSGKLRVINNSETDTARSTSVNGIGGTGGGRFTFKPTSREAGAANVDNSNRDHIDQDAEADIKKKTAVQPVKPGISDQGAASNLSSYGTAPPPKGEDDKLPGLVGEPIEGVDVNLGENPGGIVASSKTDSQGNFHFDKLPAGNYQLKIPGLPAQSLTVGVDGNAGGKVMKGPDGSMSIFDRWGNLLVSRVAPKNGPDGNPVWDDTDIVHTTAPGSTYTTGDFTAPELRAKTPPNTAGNPSQGKKPRTDYNMHDSEVAAPPHDESAKSGNDDRKNSDNPDQPTRSKTAKKPVGFGSGNNPIGGARG